MTLEKAIEILTDRSHNITTTHHEDLLDALKLGIGALRRIRTLRAEPHLSACTPLPSETEF